mmetsp:Transcript_135706/g.247463  ORF Transcript_135706/g.247463 Transcript_135706/m.247463 type:complete len:471 (-) Transcript_135706:131-1543(-)
MSKIPIVLACLTCTVNGRRVQTSSERLQSTDLLEDSHSIRQQEDEDAWRPVHSLVTFLLGFSPTAAFKAGGPGASCYTDPRPMIRGQRVPDLCMQTATMAIPGVAEPLASIGKSVAKWCMSSDRAEATIAVSSGTTTAHVLRDFYKMARRFAEEDVPRGSVRIMAFPRWDEAMKDHRLFDRTVEHITQCSDICEYLGESMLLAGRHPLMKASASEPTKPPCPILILRSFTQKGTTDWSEENPDEDDPFGNLPDEPMFQQEETTESDEEILAQTKKWVEAVIVKMKVCPFSNTADKAGIPIGGVSYPITRAFTAEEIYENFWTQVLELRATNEVSMATVLLLTPNFMYHAPGGYDALADTLNSGLSLLGFEKEVQLVFFHPEYTFRDGTDRVGDGAAANYARRSPFPMINLLRTPQVREAQKGIPTGSVYITNEKNMKLVGQEALDKMLKTRDWTDLFGQKFIPHKDNLWG